MHHVSGTCTPPEYWLFFIVTVDRTNETTMTQSSRPIDLTTLALVHSRRPVITVTNGSNAQTILIITGLRESFSFKFAEDVLSDMVMNCDAGNFSRVLAMIVGLLAVRVSLVPQDVRRVATRTYETRGDVLFYRWSFLFLFLFFQASSRETWQLSGTDRCS